MRTRSRSESSRPRAQDDIDAMIAWYKVNKPTYHGELHVTLGDDTLRKFAARVTRPDGSGYVEPDLWTYGGWTLRQHHATKARKSAGRPRRK